jgi:hypothetical protein
MRHRTGWLGSKDWRKEKTKTRGWYDSRREPVVLDYEGSEKIAVCKGIRMKAWFLLCRGEISLWLTCDAYIIEIARSIVYRAFPTLVLGN